MDQDNSKSITKSSDIIDVCSWCKQNKLELIMVDKIIEPNVNSIDVLVWQKRQTDQDNSKSITKSSDIIDVCSWWKNNKLELIMVDKIIEPNVNSVNVLVWQKQQIEIYCDQLVKEGHNIGLNCEEILKLRQETEHKMLTSSVNLLQKIMTDAEFELVKRKTIGDFCFKLFENTKYGEETKTQVKQCMMEASVEKMDHFIKEFTLEMKKLKENNLLLS